MKKRVLSLLLVALLLLPCIGVGATAQHITLNGELVTIPEDMGKIQTRDDRTFVPVRFVCENLGCSVTYNDEQVSATITDANNVSYLIADNSPSLFVLPYYETPLLYTMDTLTFIDETDGRMYVPIRFLATAMGYTVDWDDATKTVSLTKNAEDTATGDVEDADPTEDTPVIEETETVEDTEIAE